ncbi:hypothetical protein ACFTXM_36730 [Streptomyces sp. NPDC056930]|uniref:hypothetical protein n=1 Tax=Streptomyces sp. NPDC056930 TaxID=3345967 RepID=UPI0036276269
MKRVASPALWQPPMGELAPAAQKVLQAAPFALMAFSTALWASARASCSSPSACGRDTATQVIGDAPGDAVAVAVSSGRRTR